MKQIQALEAWKQRTEEEKQRTKERAEQLLRERQRQLQEQEGMALQQRQRGGPMPQQQPPPQQQMPQRIPQLDEIPFDNEFFQTQMALVMSMGFDSERRVKRALLLNDMNADAAVNWLMENASRQEFLEQEFTQEEFMRVAEFFRRFIASNQPPNQ